MILVKAKKFCYIPEFDLAQAKKTYVGGFVILLFIITFFKFFLLQVHSDSPVVLTGVGEVMEVEQDHISGFIKCV